MNINKFFAASMLLCGALGSMKAMEQAEEHTIEIGNFTFTFVGAPPIKYSFGDGIRVNCTNRKTISLEDKNTLSVGNLLHFAAFKNDNVALQTLVNLEKVCDKHFQAQTLLQKKTPLHYLVLNKNYDGINIFLDAYDKIFQTSVDGYFARKTKYQGIRCNLSTDVGDDVSVGNMIASISIRDLFDAEGFTPYDIASHCATFKKEVLDRLRPEEPTQLSDEQKAQIKQQLDFFKNREIFEHQKSEESFRKTTIRPEERKENFFDLLKKFEELATKQ